MDKVDKQEFQQARPFVVGVIGALCFIFRTEPIGSNLEPLTAEQSLDRSELLVSEWERRNGVTDGDAV